MTPTAVPTAPQPWYRALNRSQWNALLATNLGWAFDGYATYALFLVVGVALRQLLDPSQYSQLPIYAGAVICITVLGWGIGGLIGGVLSDYIGRKRMMIIAVLAYSLTTALSALAWNWWSFALLRFLVGIGIGSEWATGASLTTELWPDNARGRGAALMQSGLGFGFFIASFLWFLIGDTGPNAWRYMFLLGAVPTLLTIWIQRHVAESEKWQKVAERRQAAVEHLHSGLVLDAEEQKLVRFTIVDLFAEKEVRRRTIFALCLTLATTVGWFGISSWVPSYISSVAVGAGLSPERWAGYAGMAYNTGSIIGFLGLGFMADAYGRKPAAIIFFAMSLLMTPVLFLWTHELHLLLFVAALNGFFTMGQYAWMPAWLPELFPTSIRATAIAFCFNTPRVVAAFSPLVAGAMIAGFGGFGNAAMIVSVVYLLGIFAAPFLPETNGRPLPEKV